MVSTAFAQSEFFEDKGKFGLRVRGKIILKAKYEKIKGSKDWVAEEDDEKHLVAVKQKGKWGFFNLKGKEVIPIKYEDCAELFAAGLVRVKLNGKWGFVDNTGTEKIPLKYEEAKGFPTSGSGMDPVYAAVKINGKWGFVDNTGSEVIPFIYDDAFTFGEGIAQVYLNGRGFKINSSGTEVEQEKPTYNTPTDNNTPTNNTPKKMLNWRCSQCSDTKVSEDKPMSGSGGCRYVDNNGTKRNGSHKYVKQ